MKTQAFIVPKDGSPQAPPLNRGWTSRRGDIDMRNGQDEMIDRIRFQLNGLRGRKIGPATKHADDQEANGPVVWKTQARVRGVSILKRP